MPTTFKRIVYKFLFPQMLPSHHGQLTVGEYHVIAPLQVFLLGLSLSFAERGAAPRFRGRGSLRCGALGREIRGVVTRGGEGPPGEVRGGYVFSTNFLHTFTPYKCLASKEI